MEAEIAGGTKCIFRWKIENCSQYWQLGPGEPIKSPVFKANSLQDTEWYLSFDLPDCESVAGLYLHRQINDSGPDVIEVCYQFAILYKDESILMEGPDFKEKFSNDDCAGWASFQLRCYFTNNRNEFICKYEVNIQCTIWIKENKPLQTNYLNASTIFKLKQRNFLWKVDKVSTLKSAMKNKFKHYLIEFFLILNEGLDRIHIDITSFDDSIKYISCNAAIIDSEKRKENCEIKKKFDDGSRKRPMSFLLFLPKMLNENKSQYIPNDVLTLDFEFVLLTVKDSSYRRDPIMLENEVVETKKSQNTSGLIEDLKALYIDGTFHDIKLLTSTKTFPANRFILNARSPVFRNMFTKDVEMNSGQIEISDFDDDSVQRMLLYMYTDSLEGLDFEGAIELYKIADKYHILSLKGRCSSFLQLELCSTNVYEVLVLADIFNDDELMNAAQDYIIGERKQIFHSEEWKTFMTSHLKLAADTMYETLIYSTIHPY